LIHKTDSFKNIKNYIYFLFVFLKNLPKWKLVATWQGKYMIKGLDLMCTHRKELKI